MSPLRPLLPMNIDGRLCRSLTPGWFWAFKRSKCIQGLLLALLGLWLTGRPAVSGEAAAKVEMPQFNTVKLENGMTLLLLERRQLPLINFHWLLRSGGSTGDPDGKEGLALLTAQMLRKGTQSRTADQFSEALDFVGAAFTASASLDYSSGSVEFVKNDLALAVELLAEALQRPTFPQDEVQKMIQQEVDGIKEDKAVPRQVIGRYYESFLFGNHPYGRVVGGVEESLRKISRDDLIAFHTGHYAPNEMILVVVGDFSTPELEKQLRAKFSPWQSKQMMVTRPPAPTAVKSHRVLAVEKPDSTQTFFRLGNIGLARTNVDWVPLQVVNTLFGGRFTSMINNELRIQSGLTYGASSAFVPHLLPGPFFISSFTPNEKTEQALEMTLEVLKRLHEKGVSAEQLESAKAYIKGQFGPTLETNDQLARTMAELEFYGLGPQYINTYFERVDGTTLTDAKRLIEKYYPQDNLALVLIGQQAIIEPVARKIGKEVSKKSITDPGF